MDKEFLSPPKRPDRPWKSPSLPLRMYRGSFQMVNRPGREVDHRPTSRGEIKNESSYDSTPHTRVHGVDSYSFTFTNGVYCLICSVPPIKL